MNNLLELKGNFEKKKGRSPGPRNIPSNGYISLSKFDKLIAELELILDYWQNNKIITHGALFTVRYINVVSKSNRCKSLFFHKGKNADSCIVGAKFSNHIDLNKEVVFKHNITYFTTIDALIITITNLKIAKIFISSFLKSDSISYSDIENINKNNIIPPDSLKISKTKLIGTIVDVYYIDEFYLDLDVDAVKSNSIITIYNTEVDTVSLLRKIGINIDKSNILLNNTILLKPDELNLLKLKAPYLISMAVSDISKISIGEFKHVNKAEEKKIYEPTNEPIIGVIDTLFDKKVYFSEWVEYEDMVDSNIPKNAEDYNHGTAVTSIIVDGPSINENLDDGCGKFRVKHFGVMAGKEMSSFSVLQKIQEIVLRNPNIKVWNLSLGAIREVSLNSISPEAAILDEIQYKNDVTFIIAGTNDNEKTMLKRVGSPADSINSIVVNSVAFNKDPATYTRSGPVLSFYNKPDLSYYGGDVDGLMRVCYPTGEAMVSGTSYAAPWVTRKFAYLIHKLNLSKEVAKALLIDAAAGWEVNQISNKIGFGVLPININDIVNTPKEEIRFFIAGRVESHESYNYSLPIPINSDSKHPYKARATLCYYPHCNRNQGVDYTSTELSISFGRLTEKTAKGKKYTTINSINGNLQDDEISYVYEHTARRSYRKWDNVKHVKEKLSKLAVKPHFSNMWGLRVVQKERNEERFGNDIAWGVVVTLKDIEGKNRIENFIQQCKGKQWIVNRINIEQKIEIYNQAEQKIEFND